MSKVNPILPAISHLTNCKMTNLPVVITNLFFDDIRCHWKDYVQNISTSFIFSEVSFGNRKFHLQSSSLLKDRGEYGKYFSFVLRFRDLRRIVDIHDR